MKKALLLGLLAFAQMNTNSVAAAQSSIFPIQLAKVGDIFNKKATLPAGTLVLLELSEQFSSDQATIGKQLQFKVRTNVMAENEVVISTNALATGRIKRYTPGSYNSPAELTIELQFVQAIDGQMVALNGNEQTLLGVFSQEGTTASPGVSITAQIMNTIDIQLK